MNELGCDVLPHPPYSPDHSLTNHFFKHLDDFLQGKCFHNDQEAENASQKFVESQSTNFLCYRNKQTFLIGKNVLILLVPILSNKDMLSPISIEEIVFPPLYILFSCHRLIDHIYMVISGLVCFESREYDPSSFVLSQGYFGYLGLLWFHTDFRILCSNSVKHAMGILIGIDCTLPGVV